MSDTKPLLTVVTVCKNAEETIEKTLESVAAQTCKDFEFIVIDGASSDGTMDIVKRYEHCIQLYKSELDDNSFHAANKSLKLVNGQYIAWLSADDWLADNAIEKIINALREHPGVDMVSYALSEQQVDENNQATPIRLFEEFGDVFDLETGLFCHGINHTYRLGLLEDLGGFDYHNYSFSVDRELHVRLGMQSCTKHYIDDVLYYFRVHKGSSTTNGDIPQSRAAMWGYKKIAKHYINTSQDIQHTQMLKRWFFYASVRQSYFYAKDAQYWKAVLSLLCDAAIYPVSFLKSLRYLATPCKFRPKEIA